MCIKNPKINFSYRTENRLDDVVSTCVFSSLHFALIQSLLKLSLYFHISYCAINFFSDDYFILDLSLHLGWNSEILALPNQGVAEP